LRRTQPLGLFSALKGVVIDASQNKVWRTGFPFLTGAATTLIIVSRRKRRWGFVTKRT
jgi:hypothetical protein